MEDFLKRIEMPKYLKNREKEEKERQTLTFEVNNQFAHALADKSFQRFLKGKSNIYLKIQKGVPLPIVIAALKAKLLPDVQVNVMFDPTMSAKEVENIVKHIPPKRIWIILHGGLSRSEVIKVVSSLPKSSNLRVEGINQSTDGKKEFKRSGRCYFIHVDPPLADNPQIIADVLTYMDDSHLLDTNNLNPTVYDEGAKIYTRSGDSSFNHKPSDIASKSMNLGEVKPISLIIAKIKELEKTQISAAQRKTKISPKPQVPLSANPAQINHESQTITEDELPPLVDDSDPDSISPKVEENELPPLVANDDIESIPSTIEEDELPPLLELDDSDLSHDDNNLLSHVSSSNSVNFVVSLAGKSISRVLQETIFPSVIQEESQVIQENNTNFTLNRT